MVRCDDIPGHRTGHTEPRARLWRRSGVEPLGQYEDGDTGMKAFLLAGVAAAALVLPGVALAGDASGPCGRTVNTGSAISGTPSAALRTGGNSTTAALRTDQNSTTAALRTDQNSTVAALRSPENSTTAALRTDQNSTVAALRSPENSTTAALRTDQNSTVAALRSPENSTVAALRTDENSTTTKGDGAELRLATALEPCRE